MRTINRMAMELLIRGKCSYTSGYPYGFLHRDPASVEVVPETGDGVAEGCAGHVGCDDVDSDIEFFEIVAETTHDTDNLHRQRGNMKDGNWGNGGQRGGTPCFAAE